VNIPITIAHLCGPLGQALAVVDGETWLYENRDKRRPTSNEIHFFFQNGMEVRAVDPSRDGPLNEDNLLSALGSEARRFEALQGLLIGMDPELTDDLRQKGMRRANRLLADQAISKFIEVRFLRPLSHQLWDLAGALHLAGAITLSLVERMYAIVNGDLLVRLADETAIWAREYGYTSVERAVAVDEVFDSGLAAAIATAVHDNNQSRARAEIFLARNAEWDRRLATHLIHHFAPSKAPPDLAATIRENEEDHSESNDADIIAWVRQRLSQLLEEFGSRRRRQGHRIRVETGGAELLPVILVQIEWIIGRFETGHLQAAWNDVVDLVRRQLASGDPDKLAMSLTSLATRLSSKETVASALCDMAAMCAPEDPAVATARAELLRTWGRLDEALAAYDRTVDEFPHDAIARNGRAETLRALGRLDEALAAYDRTVEEFPKNASARNGRAETLRALGRLDEALAAYDRTVEEFPREVVARSGRAETLRALDRLDEALAAYDRTVDEFPHDAIARNGRAETLRALGRLDEALVGYDRTVEAFPRDAIARNGRAETLRALGRLDEALAGYDRTVEAFPRDAFARTGRAETLRELGRLDEALAGYDRTVEAFPRDAIARTGRAETLRELGRLDEALAAYDRTVEAFPHDAIVHNGRAETLRDLGRLDEALAAYDRTAERFPHNTSARNGRAETLRDLGRLDEALAAYDRTAEEFPQNTFARNGRAVVLSDLGRPDEARVVLKDASLAPRTQGDWVAVHILCMIDLILGATNELAQRLAHFSIECPYPRSRLYFETTLVVVRIALKQTNAARHAMQNLVMRPEFGLAERAALQLMEAHAEAIDGDFENARRTLAAASNVVSYEQFRLRRIRQEIERRFGLGHDPVPTKLEETVTSEDYLVRLETEFWVDRATTSSARRAA
jgi:tetratricopeptide (TPR) repeat protein